MLTDGAMLIDGNADICLLAFLLDDKVSIFRALNLLLINCNVRMVAELLRYRVIILIMY